jgi:hypothetical protein
VRDTQQKAIADALTKLRDRRAKLSARSQACKDAEAAEAYARRMNVRVVIAGWTPKQVKACAKLKRRWKAKLRAREKRAEAKRRRALRKAEAKRRLEARRAELRRRREERRERARKRSKCYRERRGSAKCCDGTLSPSCGCGGGRGCCSHHRGVCGCSCDDL